MKSKLWYLSQSRLFSELTPEEMVDIEKMTVMTETPKRNSIYLPGDQADKIYLIKKGKVRISRISQGGEEFTLAILGSGDFFGELSLLDDQEPRNEMAEALEDTLLCLISKNDFENILASKPRLNLKVTKLMGWRIRSFENRIENLIFKSTAQRLEILLKELAHEFGVSHAEGILIDLKLSHEELGKLINASRQTVSEVVTTMKKQGKLIPEGRKIVLSHSFIAEPAIGK